jgi:long-chain acyl-CoA synthetase
MVTRVLEHPDILRRNVQSLRSVSLGGSPVPLGLLDRIRTAFPNTRAGVGKIYGLTEAGGTLTSASGRDLMERPGTVGRPLPLTEIRIGSPNSDGLGEILARSPTQMDGYWGAPDYGVIDANGWIHTGDLGHLDADGYLYVTGRSKEVIIRGGENIASAHVEEQLLQHPDILECAVLGLPSDDLGEEVAAVVVLRDASAIDAHALATFLRERLAYFEIPSHWWIRDSRLPWNSTGKVDKRQLAAEWPARSASLCLTVPAAHRNA